MKTIICQTMLNVWYLQTNKNHFSGGNFPSGTVKRIYDRKSSQPEEHYFPTGFRFQQERKKHNYMQKELSGRKSDTKIRLVPVGQRRKAHFERLLQKPEISDLRFTVKHLLVRTWAFQRYQNVICRLKHKTNRKRNNGWFRFWIGVCL